MQISTLWQQQKCEKKCTQARNDRCAAIALMGQAFFAPFLGPVATGQKRLRCIGGPAGTRRSTINFLVLIALDIKSLQLIFTALPKQK